MMKISTTTSYMASIYGEKEAVKRLADIGYDGLDFGMFNYPMDSGLYAESAEAVYDHFAELYEVARHAGIVINQVHSQMPSYVTGDEARTALCWENQKKAIAAAGALHAPFIVIHPCIFADCRYQYLRKENMELNLRFYRELTPLLERYDVRLGVENMFNWDPEKKCICPTVVSDAEEMCAYVDALGERFVACLDVGHSVLSGDGPANMARKLGHRFQLMHAHDNDGINDCHMAPMIGFSGKAAMSRIDWAEFAQAMKDVSYPGMFSLEPDSFASGYGSELAYEAEIMMYKICRAYIKEYGL